LGAQRNVGRRTARIALLAAAAASLSWHGTAQGAAGWIDEVKLGVEAHDINFFGVHVENGADINQEILFTSPDFLSIIGSPRPHIGGQINTAGNTDQAYFGLTWGWTLFTSILQFGDALRIYGSLGGAYQDGYSNNAPDGRKNLGSPILFRESLELGYQVTETIGVSAILDHISNANLATHNAGITNAGGRIGFRF
jgi:lipid A 3-O-deacylase